MSRLRVCLDARLMTGVSGGIEQAIIGLAHGLSHLNDGDEEYLFLTYPHADTWLHPYLGGPCRIVHAYSSSSVGELRRIVERMPQAAVSVVRNLGTRKSLMSRLGTLTVPVSDGTIEREHVDVMHFTYQFGFRTRVTSLYQPWDLQHRHLPQFFLPRQRLIRELFYRTLCDQAKVIVVASSWVRRDFLRHYRTIPKAKIAIVPVPPPVSVYPDPTAADLKAAQQKFALPERFIFYPAQTWPHKNHLALLEALALLRDRRGLVVPCVVSGSINSFYRTIERRIERLRLIDQVTFLGFVDTAEVQSLYRLCRCMVYPSQFEGWGLPVTEAFLAGVPVACARVTSLPDLTGDAALLFDPGNPEEIADAIQRLWTDDRLCQTLVERGHQRAAMFSWDQTARLFRAHYRRLASRPLTDEDRSLLAMAPSI